MTPTDCVDVVEFLAARCPAMRMHEQTPDAWYVDLAGYDRATALEAVRNCSRDADFVSLASLIAECDQITDRKRGRQRRAELEAQIERENAGELHQRPVAALTVGQSVGPATLMRQQVAAKRHEIETDIQAIAEQQQRREQARAEVEQLHAQGSDA